MRLVTSLLVGALGVVARFEASAQVAGFKMHAIGVLLMVAAVAGVVSLMPFSIAWTGVNRARRGDTVLLGHHTSPETLTLES